MNTYYNNKIMFIESIYIRIKSWDIKKILDNKIILKIERREKLF